MRPSADVPRLRGEEAAVLRIIRRHGSVLGDATGSTLIEYALIATVISIAIMTGLSLMSSDMSSMFNSIASHF